MSKPKNPPSAPDARAGAQRSNLTTTPAPLPDAPQPAPAASPDTAATAEKE